MVRGLTPDNEAFIEQAVASGQFATREEAINAAVRQLSRNQLRNVEDQTSSDSNTETATAVSKNQKSQDEWLEWFDRWISNRTGSGHFVDDSRESIY